MFRHGGTAEEKAPASSFYGYDISLNFMKADLAKKKTTCMIADYIWNIRKKNIKDWYDKYVASNSNDMPHSDPINLVALPPASIGAFFMCDGQPAAQLSSMIATDD